MPTVTSPLVQSAALARRNPEPEPPAPTGPLPSELFATPKAAAVLDALVDKMGGLDTLVANLLLVPAPTTAMRLLLTYTLDPQYDTWSFGRFCAMSGLTPGEIFAVYTDVLAAKGALMAMKQNTDALPQVLESIIESATAHTETCPKCSGTGTRTKRAKGKPPEQIDCPDCSGTGVQVFRADRTAQTQILDMVGLNKKTAGIVLNQQTNVVAAAATGQAAAGVSLSTDAIAGGLPQLQQAVAGILFGKDAVRKRTAPSPPTPADSPERGEPIEALEGELVPSPLPPI